MFIGDILFSDVQQVLPFGNTFDAVEIEGRYIKEMLEHSVSSLPVGAGRFLQVAGTLCLFLLFLLFVLFLLDSIVCERGRGGVPVWGGVGCCYIIERLGMLSCSRLLSASVYDVFATQLMPS